MEITGPSGTLEAVFDSAPDAHGAAVLCHPHPQYGGSMHDGVLAIAADACARAHISHLRFNFRGVGSSTGEFDQGVGEQADVVAACDWLVAETSNLPLWLIGYSFGAAMAWAARHDCPPLTGLILIAPPTAGMAFQGDTGMTAAPCTVIVGANDSYYAAASPPPGALVHELPGADHFFSGASSALAERLDSVLGATPA